MKIKELFPLFFKNCQSDERSYWDCELIGQDFEKFIDCIEDELEESSKLGLDEFQTAAKLLLVDILTSKSNKGKQELINLNYLQFFISTTTATFLCNQGLFTLTFDWLVWSVSDEIEYGTEVTYYIEWIDSFYSNENDFISNNITPLYFEWMSTLFYYSRSQGGLKELAQNILNNEFCLISNLPTSCNSDNERAKLNLLCQALAWSIDNKESIGYKCANIIEDWIPNLSPENQKIANLQLATGGAQFTEKDSEFYAKQVIENYSLHCKAHELLHAQSIYYTSNLDKLISNPDLLKQGFEDYSSSLGDKITNISKKYEKGRIFGIIRGLVLACLNKRKAKLAFYLLSQFFEKGNNYNHHLFLALNIEKQVCSYIMENHFIEGDEISTEEYRMLIQITNKFLGTKISLKDDPDFILEEPENLGLPDKNYGIQFEQILSKYYSLSCLEEYRSINFESLVIIPGHQHPVQSLMIKELGYSAPINSSLEKPKPSKKVEKVLLWCYGTLSSDREMELVSQMFLKSKIDVDVINIHEETKESFLEKFNNPEYDIVWVATHGNYNHVLPHKSTLSILPEIELTIEELTIQQSDFQHQRLLFLNVCDGATSLTNHSLYEHGFGASLANSSQSVISHLWPIETEPALYYAVLYAHNLVNHNFWESYTKIVELLSKKGKLALQEIIEEYNELDFNKIEENIVDDIEENIYYWGSSVYYN